MLAVGGGLDASWNGSSFPGYKVLVPALKKKEELVDQLRAKDPKAEVDVTHEEQGKYTINKIDFNGHVFLCPVVVDRYSDVKDIVRTATTRCLCC